ncbi:MAG: DCC1-like thiol-disulfide oxidoreductase family protein [Pseudomonadota bacterium]
MSETETVPNYLLYDGECPLCSRYVQMVNLRRQVGEIGLINAREDHPVVAHVIAQGYDLNEGIVWLEQDRIYFAEAAMHRISQLSDGRGLFSRLNRIVFRKESVARLVYPLLKAGRGLLLRLLGRKPI